mgnify:CR=1 FL=1
MYIYTNYQVGIMHVLIVDDEKGPRETVKEVIKLYCPEITSVAEAEGVKDAVALIDSHHPDLVFLDIRLKDGSGFDVLKKAATKNLNVIFITAYEEYAISAFRVSALDYLLKPVDADELAAAVKRAERKLQAEHFTERLDAFMTNMQHASQGLKKMTLKTSESIHVVNIDDIVYCEADRNYTVFYLADGEKIVVSRSIGEYEEMLPPHAFMRVHQSFLVNVKHIKRYEKADGGFLVTAFGQQIPVATRKKDQLIQFLSKM